MKISKSWIYCTFQHFCLCIHSAAKIRKIIFLKCTYEYIYVHCTTNLTLCVHKAVDKRDLFYEFKIAAARRRYRYNSTKHSNFS